jgi:hypothetical protein
MSHPGIFAERVERGACPECDEFRCLCDREDSEPVPAAHQNDLNCWVNADTGRIITEAKAKGLLGHRGKTHAEKCKCTDCIDYQNSEPPEDLE